MPDLSQSSFVSREGISETKGREPIGCVLSCGVKKGGSGFPVEKDRFHLVVPREEQGTRPHHPAYTAFNGADPTKRRMIRGNLVHAHKADCYEGYLRAQAPIKPAHPNKRPFCIGDGVHAERWGGDVNKPDEFLQIKCPNQRCEYRLTDPPSCKPFTRLLFRLRWPDGNPLPSMLCKFTSGGWNTYGNIKGFFDYIENAAHGIGLQQYTLFGFPFTLTLTQQTKPSQKTRFPVVAITPEMDPVEFFARQSEQLSALKSVRYESITDQRQTALEYEDIKALEWPSGGKS